MRRALLNATLRGADRVALALLFLSLVPPPPDSPLAYLAEGQGLPVLDMERCFVCCCPLLPSLDPPPNPSCLRRARPGFCAGGPFDGGKCALGGAAGECGAGGRCADTGTVECAEADGPGGIVCVSTAQAPNLTTAVNFSEPTGWRRLEVPDASGTFVTTGNLQLVTALGVQARPPRARLLSVNSGGV